MALWGYDKRPTWAPFAVINKRGWINPATGEVLVALGNLDDRRIDYLDPLLSNLLHENGGFFVLEQDLSNDLGIDFLTIE